MDSSFSTLSITGSAPATTTTPLGPIQLSVTASTTAEFSPLELYFHVGSQRELTMVLEDPPSVGAIVSQALRRPGLRSHDLAIELLGHLPGQTLQFVMQVFPDTAFIARPVYANRTWSIVITALGQAEDLYVPAIANFIRYRLLNDPDPIKRLAAQDALETLSL
jgi:hypothetical protein